MTDKTPSPARAAFKSRYAERMQQKWQDPEYRARLVEKQRALGFRSYPSKNKTP